jgi:hypothetical protein
LANWGFQKSSIDNIKIPGHLKIHIEKNTVALAAWSSGIVYVCGVMGREIESIQGIGFCLF